MARVLKILVVYSGRMRPDLAELRRLESAGLSPRITIFETILNADVLEAQVLRQTNGQARRKDFLGRHTTNLALVWEAFKRREQYDVIVAWSESITIPLAGLLKMSRSKVRMVALMSWPSKMKKALPLRAFRSAIDKIILMSSAQFHLMRERFRYPAAKLTLTRWPVDLRFWVPREQEGDQICSVGREMRDYATLIEALKGTDVPCHIAANIMAGRKDAWRSTLSDHEAMPANVTVGAKNFADLRDLYARSRFVVIPLLPTDTDNGTTSILEAMAMGKAVICSDVRGQRDVVVNGTNGLLVPPQDTDALRNAILHLWNHPEEARAMGRAARKTVEDGHSLDHWLESVRTVVHEVAGSGS